MSSRCILQRLAKQEATRCLLVNSFSTCGVDECSEWKLKKKKFPLNLILFAMHSTFSGMDSNQAVRFGTHLFVLVTRNSNPGGES